jgi:hypothetical protein
MIKYISIRSDGQMANKYNAEERAEALKLADEIGAAAAVQRLGMNADTIFGVGIKKISYIHQIKGCLTLPC